MGKLKLPNRGKKSTGKGISMCHPSDKSEKEWRAESDARLLVEAEEVRKDSSRMRAASRAAGRMIREQEDKIVSMRRIARSKT